MSSHAYQKELGPILSAATVAGGGSVQPSAIDCTGFNQLTLEIDFTYVAATAVGISAIEAADDLSSATWRKVQSVSVASGVGTCSDLSYTKAVSAADVHFCLNIPLNYKAVRLTFTSTGGTTDAITVRGRLGVV